MLIRKEDEAGWRRTEIAGSACNQLATILPERRVSKNRLHNFSFPTMSWGRHRVFRCVNSIAETGLSGTLLTDMDVRCRSSSPMKVQSEEIPAGGTGGKDTEKDGTAAVVAMPWNLRKRRAACFAPGVNGRSRCPSIPISNGQFGKSNQGFCDQVLEDGRQRYRRKFSVSLSREEIEEDFIALKGAKPHRRPQKRARIVQRQLDDLFPGFWLEEITPDSYKVEERDESKKMQRNDL